MGLGIPSFFHASLHHNHTRSATNAGCENEVKYRSDEEKKLFKDAVEHASGRRTLENIRNVEVSQNEKCIKMWSDLLTGVKEGATLGDFNILMKCFMKEAKNRGCTQVLLISDNGPILIRPRLLSGGSLRYNPREGTVTKRRYPRLDGEMTEKILRTLHAETPNINAIIEHDAEGVLSSMMPTEYDSNASHPELEKALVVPLLSGAASHVVLEAHERLANSRAAGSIRVDPEQTIPKRIYTIARPDLEEHCSRSVETRDRLRNPSGSDSIRIDPEPTTSAQADAIEARDDSANIYETVPGDDFAEPNVREARERQRNLPRTRAIPNDPLPLTSSQGNAIRSSDDSVHAYSKVNKSREDERIHIDPNVVIINGDGPPSTSSSDIDDSYEPNLDPNYAELDYGKAVNMRRPVPHPPGGLHETIQNSTSQFKKRTDGSIPHQSGRYERRFRPNGELYEIRYEDSGTAPKASSGKSLPYSYETKYLESGYPYELRTYHQTERGREQDKPRVTAVSLKKKADQQPASSMQPDIPELFGPETLV